MKSALDDLCLVLNSQWRVLRCIPVRTAIEILMRGRGVALDTRDSLLLDWDAWLDYHPPQDYSWIRTVNSQVPSPQVIVLVAYGQLPPKKLTWSRGGLMRRDHFICQYCHKNLPISELTVDHVVPRAKKGKTSWENTVAACRKCNSDKADKTLAESGFKLKTAPAIPKWAPRLRLPAEIKPAWEDFLRKDGLID